MVETFFCFHSRFTKKKYNFFGVSVKNRKLRFLVCLESDGNGVNIVTAQLYIHIIFIFLSYGVNELILVEERERKKYNKFP